MSRALTPAERKRLYTMLELERTLWEKGMERVAGLDEAGRGALAGPVVAAAVIFPRSQMLIGGLNDSKRLSPAKRNRLFTVISSAAVGVGVGTSASDVIDRNNIRQANLMAMREAVGTLPETPDYLLIDGIDTIDWVGPQEAVVKGDARCMTVAAASIIAKVTRDRIMIAYDGEYPEYGFSKHKGYGTADHIAAICKYGMCPLHRRSFHLKDTPASA